MTTVIAGISVGGVVVVALIIAGVFCVRYYSKQRALNKTMEG